MSDIGADLEAATIMVYDAQDVLSRLNPDHSLVSCLFPRNEEERNKQWQKLLRSFAKDPHAKGNVKGGMECTYALSSYLAALREAITTEDVAATTKGGEDNSFLLLGKTQ